MGKAPQTYGEAMEAARGLLNASRLADPLEHFPYKHADVCALVDENPPMGRNGPDDDSFLAEDYMSQEIADCSAVYVAAQADYLKDPGDATREAYEVAKSALIASRQAHRINRDVPMTVRARRAGE